MTDNAAITLAKYQMQEMGITDYLVRFRHFNLAGDEIRTIRGENQFFYLLDSPPNIKVESKAGWYDTKSSATNEQQHVHRGIITLKNHDESPNDVRFIQI